MNHLAILNAATAAVAAFVTTDNPLIVFPAFAAGYGLTVAWQSRHAVKAVIEEATSGIDFDVLAISQGRCPDCRQQDTLCVGPSGGMSQNVLCSECRSEYNIHHSFGGILGVDRSGKCSPDRARSAFGVE